jgi:transglutaminase-like putative cysteine protease
LAWRLDATLGALGPSLVLFVAVAALGEGAHWPTTFLYGAAAAAFLLAVQYAELLERRTWFHLPRHRRSRLLTGGIAAAVFAVVLALVIGPLLPGARGEAWFDYRGLGDRRSGSGTWRTVTPLVDIKTRLVNPSNAELFRVKADRPAYWRMVALDEFNGEVWGLESEASRVGNQLPTTGPASPRSQPLTQEFDIGPLNSRWLPAAFRAVAIDGADNARVIPESLSLVTGNATSNDTKYTVQSEVPAPTQAELRASPPVRPAQYASLLKLPGDFPQDVRDLADAVTKDARAPYDKAIALQDYLRDPHNYTYDTNVDPGHSDRALERFLFQTKRGYCEQFAGSYAAMARSIGLPARVAVGFTYGSPDRNDVWHVTDKDAHAWPEVWLENIGWMPFEPTPTRSEPTPGDPTHTGGAAARTQRTTPTTADATPTTTAPAGPQASIDANRFRDEFINANGGGLEDEKPASTWPRVLLGIAITIALAVVVAVVVLLAVLIVKWRRRHRRRHAADERDRVTGAWAEALDRLREAGVSPRESATPVEFALRHAAASGAGAAGPPLMDLARLQTAALFAPEAPSHEDADEAWVQVHQIEVALRRATRPTRRWRRRVDPRSLRVPVRTG